MADHVPLGVFQVGQGSGFAGKFLNPVFAEDTKSRLRTPRG